MKRYLVLMKDHEPGEKVMVFAGEARPALRKYMEENGLWAVRMATRQALTLHDRKLRRHAILEGLRIPIWKRPVRII